MTMNDAAGNVPKEFVFTLMLLHICLKEHSLCLSNIHDVKLQTQWQAGLKFQREKEKKMTWCNLIRTI